jgi:hypothetical protein
VTDDYSDDSTGTFAEGSENTIGRSVEIDVASTSGCSAWLGFDDSDFLDGLVRRCCLALRHQFLNRLVGNHVVGNGSSAGLIGNGLIGGCRRLPAQR